MSSSLQLQPFSYENLSIEQAMMDLAARFVLNCPAEDLSTPVRLMFQVEEANWFYVDFVREQNKKLPMLRIKGFVAKLYQCVPLMAAIYPDYEDAVSQFSKYKKGIPVRGGIILNEAMDKILLVRAWKSQTWCFPRGKINKGEDDLVCAIREVLEETGFDVSPYVRSRKDCAEHTIQGKNFLMFFATGVPENTKFETRTRAEIEEIRWIPLKSIRQKAGSRSFFLVPAFMRDIMAFVNKANRHKKSTGSSAKSNDLKQLLGISASRPGAEISLEPETRMELESELGSELGSEFSSEFSSELSSELGSELGSEPGSEPDSKRAKQFLALLNSPDEWPAWHDRSEHHPSTKPTAKPKLRQTSLLQVLNSPHHKKQNKLMDLLQPSKQSERSNKTERSENSLMKLLGIEPVKPAVPPSEVKEAPRKTIEEPAGPEIAHEGTVELPKAPEDRSKTPPREILGEVPKKDLEDNGSEAPDEKVNLLTLLGMEWSNTRPGGTTSSSSSRSPNQTSEEVVAKPAQPSLLSLLSGTQNQAEKPEDKPEQKGNALLSLLGR